MAEETTAKSSKKKLTKLERLQQQQAKIAAQIRAEKNREKAQARKEDTRRKIIMGALVLSHMEKDETFRKECERLQREGIKKDVDRNLFGLPPLSAENQSG
jgi:hypothetical protein